MSHSCRPLSAEEHTNNGEFEYFLFLFFSARALACECSNSSSDEGTYLPPFTPHMRLPLLALSFAHANTCFSTHLPPAFLLYRL